ncbi:MAG: hypothetical protein ACRDC6_15615 [Shewanella sp.]
MMIYLQKRVIDQNGRSPSSAEKAKNRCGMTDHKKFRRLIEKYEFFEHLTQVDNIHDALFLFYDISAYGWSNKKCHKKALISLVCSEVTDFDGAVEEITAYSYNAKTSRCEVVNIRDLSLVERENWVKSGEILWVEKTIEYPSK